MILKHSTINLKFCNSLNSQHFQNCVKTEQHSCEDLMVMTFASQSGYATASYSELCFAKRSATAASFFAVHWSKHFATQNGILSKFCYAKPPIQNFATQSGFATAFIFAVH